MATSQSRRLDAAATPFVPPPSMPALEMYMGPPPAALAPQGFYPVPVFLAPPPPGFGFPANPLGCWGFPQGPGVGMQQGSFPHHVCAPLAMGASPAPAGTQCAPRPHLPGMTAAPLGGRHPPSRSVRRPAGRAPGARPLRHLDVPPRMQRAAGRPAPTLSSRGAKGEPANEPSPRSVLVRASPPDSPSVLPTSFPYPELGSPSPPASAGAPWSVSAPAAEIQPVVPPPRRRCERTPRHVRQVYGRIVRRSEPKPRLLFDASSSKTSLMIRNIPNDFRRTRLMQIIDQHCSFENEKITSGGVKSEYDFLYLPVDFHTGANKGYAFVNVTTPEAARRLRDYLHGRRWNEMGSGKTCEIDHAYIQGRENLVKHFSDSRFDCGDEVFLPVWFEPARDGIRATSPHLVGRMLQRW